MTALDDQELDPSDRDGNYATIEEVAAALAQLSSSELGKIELQARVLASGTSLEAGDVLNTVVERLLAGDQDRRRHWHRKETIAACIYRTMKSVVRDYWRRQQLPIVPKNDEAAGLKADPDPETQLIARGELAEVLRALGDDDNTAAIAVALADGETPRQIQTKFDLTETSYDSALRRIRRRLAKYKRSIGKA